MPLMISPGPAGVYIDMVVARYITVCLFEVDAQLPPNMGGVVMTKIAITMCRWELQA
jgi:hypothetical protein